MLKKWSALWVLITIFSGSVDSNPSQLTDILDVIDHLTQGSSLVVSVQVPSLCIGNSSHNLPIQQFTLILDDVQISGTDFVEAWYEDVTGELQNGRMKTVLRQMKVNLSAHDAAQMTVADVDPHTFQLLGQSLLECNWTGVQRGLAVYTQSQSGIQINSFDEFKMVLTFGNTLHYVIKAGICNPPINPPVIWTGRIPSSCGVQNDTITFTAHWSQGPYLFSLEMTTKSYAEVTVIHSIYSRPSYTVFHESTHSCFLNFKGSVQYFYE